MFTSFYSPYLETQNGIENWGWKLLFRNWKWKKENWDWKFITKCDPENFKNWNWGKKIETENKKSLANVLLIILARSHFRKKWAGKPKMQKIRSIMLRDAKKQNTRKHTLLSSLFFGRFPFSIIDFAPALCEIR